MTRTTELLRPLGDIARARGVTPAPVALADRYAVMTHACVGRGRE